VKVKEEGEEEEKEDKEKDEEEEVIISQFLNIFTELFCSSFYSIYSFYCEFCTDSKLQCFV